MNAVLANSDWTPLFALDRLNSWLRAEDELWNLRSCLRATIYWVKTKAILATSKRQLIGLRRVMVKSRCRRCDGTGSWVSDRVGWWEEDMSLDEYRANCGEPCRGCNATGIATLHFIETTIGPIRWHTPAPKWCSSSLDVYVPFASYWPDGDERYEMASGWKPDQKGRPLALDEVERDMLILLSAWPHDVAFSLDYHYHAGLQVSYHVTDMPKTEEFLRLLIRSRGRLA